MKTTLTMVSPQMASEMLKLNIAKNRKLMPGVVSGLVSLIRRGEWQITHQGIAISDTGKLLDGQHRLTAIVETGMTLPVNVSVDVPEAAFEATDRGMRRTLAVTAGITNSLAAVSRFLCVIEERQSEFAMTVEYLRPYIEVLGPIQSRLNPTAVRTWSAASVQSAACIRILDGHDRDYVEEVYRALVMLDYDAMPPIAQEIVRQHARVRLGATRARLNPLNFYVRCLKVFDKANASTGRLLIKNQSYYLDYTREIIRAKIRGPYENQQAVIASLAKQQPPQQPRSRPKRRATIVAKQADRTALGSPAA